MEPSQVVDPKLEGQDGQEKKEGQEGQERSVPLSALLGEREKFQTRETELRGTLEATQAELVELRKKVEKQVAEAPVDERAKARKEWSQFLGLDRVESQLTDLVKGLNELREATKDLGSIRQGSETAFRNYSMGIEAYVATQYDPKTMPVKPEAWQRLVASEMTDEEASQIANGDAAVMQTVLKRAKEQFTPAAMAARTRELQQVRGLPKPPGAGGTPPSPGPEEKPFTSLRDLHKQAGEDFMRIKERENA